MKKLILVALMVATASVSQAQKSKKAKPAATPPPVMDHPEPEPKRHAALLEARMLTPMHNLMLQWAGHWREEIRIFDANQKPPAVSPAEREGRLFQDGRFVSYTTRGVLNGEPFEAESSMGYDRLKEKFVKTWFDNLSTGILVLEGTYDEENNRIDFRGTTIDPVSRQPVEVHQIMKLVSPETQILEIYTVLKEGKEFKSMEIISTRR